LELIESKMTNIIEIKNLSVVFSDKYNGLFIPILNHLDFAIPAQSMTILFGQSGCGKSVLAESIMGTILGEPGIVSGEITLNGEKILKINSNAKIINDKIIKKDNISYYKIQNDLQFNIRGEKIGYVFQEYRNALFPHISVLKQIDDVFNHKAEIKHLDDFFLKYDINLKREQLENKKPRQISGGMTQMSVLAMALASLPNLQLLIADEITTSLDYITALHILDTLVKLVHDNKTVLFITHDDKLIDFFKSKLDSVFIALMDKGKIQFSDINTTLTISSNSLNKPDNQKIASKIQSLDTNPISASPILKMTNYSVKSRDDAIILDNINLELPAGKCFAIVGETGCGKTTIGRAIIRTINIEKDDLLNEEGEIYFKKVNLMTISSSNLRKLRREFQMIPQEPGNALDPQQSIYSTMKEAVKLNQEKLSPNKLKIKIISHLEKVGLYENNFTDMKQNNNKASLMKKTSLLSGGQKRRLVIARVNILHPELVIADEPLSELDKSNANYIKRILMEMKNWGNTIILISHDIELVLDLADYIGVIYCGRWIEFGFNNSGCFKNDARHPYSRALLEQKKIPLINKIITRPWDNRCAFKERCPKLAEEFDPKLEKQCLIAANNFFTGKLTESWTSCPNV